MKVYLLSVTWFLALGMFLSYLVGTWVLSEVCSQWKRKLGWMLVSLGSFAVSAFLFSVENVGYFRRTLAHLSLLHHAEVCDLSQESQIKLKHGMRPFEDWARHVYGLQVQAKHPERQRSFSEVSGEECDLRMPDEPETHYRWRRLKRNFSTRVIIDQERMTWKEVLLKLRLKAVDLNEKSRHLYYYLKNDLSSILKQTPIIRGSFFVLSDLNDDQRITNLTERLFLSFVPNVPRLKSIHPKWISGGSPALCDKILLHPEMTPETDQLWNHLKIYWDSCREKQKIYDQAGFKMEEKICNKRAHRRAVTLGCVVRSQKVSAPLLVRKKLEWPDLPQEMELEFGLLQIPENYLASKSEEMREFLELKLSYELARLFDSEFIYHPLAIEVPGSFYENEKKFSLANGDGFRLSRLNAMNLFSPMVFSDLPEEVMRRASWIDLKEKSWEFLRQFRAAYREHRREIF